MTKRWLAKGADASGFRRERTGVLCLHESRLLAMEMRDPSSGKRFWSFPGGALEPGETPRQGAIRETLEETGYHVSPTSGAFTNRYVFDWDGSAYHCTTHWFLAELAPVRRAPTLDADYILHSQWLDWPECRNLFTFNPGLTEAMARLLPD